MITRCSVRHPRGASRHLGGKRSFGVWFEHAQTVMAQVHARVLPAAPFAHRGFSRHTIDALCAHGIDFPERLLFATKAELKDIPEIGKASLNEIMSYRARFLNATINAAS